MDTLGKNATILSFQDRYKAQKAIHDHPQFDKDFRKWARSRQVRYIPKLYQVIKQTVWDIDHEFLNVYRWILFKEWRITASISPIETDTLGSVYAIFIHWNKHTLPRRRLKCNILSFLTICQHPVDPAPITNSIVKCKRENVIDQCVRQCTPSMRFPRR